MRAVVPRKFSDLEEPEADGDDASDVQDAKLDLFGDLPCPMVALPIIPQPEVDRRAKTSENDRGRCDCAHSGSVEIESCKVKKGPRLHQAVLFFGLSQLCYRSPCAYKGDPTNENKLNLEGV